MRWYHDLHEVTIHLIFLGQSWSLIACPGKITRFPMMINCPDFWSPCWVSVWKSHPCTSQKENSAPTRLTYSTPFVGLLGIVPIFSDGILITLDLHGFAVMLVVRKKPKAMQQCSFGQLMHLVIFVCGGLCYLSPCCLVWIWYLVVGDFCILYSFWFCRTVCICLKISCRKY